MQILTVLLVLPLLGAAMVALWPGRNPTQVRILAIAVAAVELALSWAMVGWYDGTSAELQFSQLVPWNPRLGTSFALAVDGFSFPMVLLATLLCFLAILASTGIKGGIKGYYALMLVLEAAVLGVFMAQDWSLFYVFWELTLIPLFFLIDRWGGKRKHQAALNFVLYTMGGSVFMLISLLVVFDAIPGHSFYMQDIEVR